MSRRETKNMKKAILSLAALGLGLAFGGPARADDDLEDRVAKLEKLLRRLEDKIDRLGKASSEDEEETKVEKFEKRIVIRPGDDEGRRVFLFRTEEAGDEEDVLIPRAFTHELPEAGKEPFKVLRIRAEDGDVDVRIEIDGVVYEGELHRAHGEKREKGEKAEKGERKERGESKAEEEHGAMRFHVEAFEPGEALEIEPRFEKATKAFRAIEIPEGVEGEAIRKKIRALHLDEEKLDHLRELHRLLDRALRERDDDED